MGESRYICSGRLCPLIEVSRRFQDQPQRCSSGHRLGGGLPVGIVRFEGPQLDGEQPIMG